MIWNLTMSTKTYCIDKKINKGNLKNRLITNTNTTAIQIFKVKH